MNFDMNTLANIMKMFGGMQNSSTNKPMNADFKPQNVQKPFDKSKDNNLTAMSPFVAQNGLGDKIDMNTFSFGGEKNPNSDEKTKSPMENILSLMNKRKDIEKMMPALANIFSAKQSQNPKEATKSDETVCEGMHNSPNNALKGPKQKENDKSKDLFSPIGFAGYTLISAFNRLYYNSKN